MAQLAATVTIEDVPDGSKIRIDYSDGHTVFLSVGQDSIVLQRHMGLDENEDA